jgi:hypothetical protein
LTEKNPRLTGQFPLFTGFPSLKYQREIIFSQSCYFQQEYNRLKDPQLVRLVFAYRFGKMDLNLFKRKDMHNQGMGDAGSSLQ